MFEVGGTTGETIEELWSGLMADAEQRGAGTYRVVVHEGGEMGKHYSFRVDPEYDDGDANVSPDSVSSRQLAMDYRQFALDMQGVVTTLVGIIPNILVQSGKTAGSFTKAFHEVNEQARNQSAQNAELEIQREMNVASSTQFKDTTSLIKQLLGANAAKATKTAPIEYLTEEQKVVVRGDETLSRIFLGAKVEGELLAQLIGEHQVGHHDALLKSLTDEQKGQLAGALGVSPALFNPSESDQPGGPAPSPDESGSASGE